MSMDCAPAILSLQANLSSPDVGLVDQKIRSLLVAGPVPIATDVIVRNQRHVATYRDANSAGAAGLHQTQSRLVVIPDVIPILNALIGVTVGVEEDASRVRAPDV